MADQWRERMGRWELVRGGRVIAQVTPAAGGAEVWIDARMVWQTVNGRARSIAVAMRGVEQWLARHASS